MAEWSKAHAWKVCIPLPRYRGFESLSLRSAFLFHFYPIVTEINNNIRLITCNHEKITDPFGID